MRMPGMGELLIILVIVLLVFGANKLPQLGDGIGKAIKNFKRGINHDDDIDVTPTDKRVAAELPEELLVRVVVEIGALVWPAHHRDDEVGVLPDLLVADRGLEEMGVLLDPALEVEGQRIAGRQGGRGRSAGSVSACPARGRACGRAARGR